MDPFGEMPQTSLDLLSHENTMDQQLELFAALAAPFMPEEVRVRSQERASFSTSRPGP